MEEREGMGRKANTKVIMTVLVGELVEVELRVGVTSSINTSRIIGVSHWRGVILMRVLVIENILEAKSIANA